jgi:Acetyltransferases
MPEIKIYSSDMQNKIEEFFGICFDALGWDFNLEGRHSDIKNIPEVYMKNGCMWCLIDGKKVIGTSAVRTIAPDIAELKRLYVLPEYQGRGYGKLLFETALQYAKAEKYKKIRLDTQKDRSASRHLIETHGFKEISGYNDNPFAELYYELDLI